MRPFTDERHDEIRERVVRLFAKHDEQNERLEQTLEHKRPLNEGLLEGLPPGGHETVDEITRKVRARVEPGLATRVLASEGLLQVAVPAAYGGAFEAVSPLALAVAREALAGRRADCDAALAVQALAALPIARAGTPELKQRWLRGFASGGERGAFALTERATGSDVAALATTATRERDGYRLEGEKILVSGAPSATMLVVFARTGEEEKRAISAFVVLPTAPGVAIGVVPNLGEHDLGTVRLEGVWVPESARIGAEGDGLSLALGTLELMRPTVGAAACGMAARALDETRALVRERVRGGVPLAQHESVQMRLAEMATDLEAARLLVYRAAWMRETTPAETRLPAEASMAKLFATEAAGRIVDAAVQLHGGLGVVHGAVVERLYREVRALRIYEGTSEIQKLVIARTLS